MNLYTDGACSGNPGPGGWAVTTDTDAILSGSSAHTTNNCMELTALINAYQYITTNNINNAIIYTDSAYCLNGLLQGWYKKWRKNGWKTTKGTPVANKQLWEQLIYYYEQNLAQLCKVEGHSNCQGNILADRIAVQESRMRTTLISPQ